MRISDWSSDVCSSDLRHAGDVDAVPEDLAAGRPVQPGHETHEACLAGKRRPEQHIERPVLESQRHVADVILAAKSLGDVAQLQRHPTLVLVMSASGAGGALAQRALPHEVVQPPGLLRPDPQAELGAAPQYILGGPRPFVTHEV